MSNLAAYILGAIVLLIGLGAGAHLLGVSFQWIAIGAAVILGMAIMGGVAKTRRPESPNA